MHQRCLAGQDCGPDRDCGPDPDAVQDAVLGVDKVSMCVCACTIHMCV
jgi:hypothetical protein